MRLRIAIASEYVRPWPGGISEHVHHEARGLRALGHEVTVLSGPGPAEPGVRRLPWALPFLGNGARSRMAVGPALSRPGRLVRALGCDVLHVHAPLDPFLPLFCVLGSPVPVVGTFHASFADHPSWRALYANPLARRAERKLAARIAVSATALEAHARFLSAPVEIVPNGVDTGRFAGPFAGDGDRLLFVGRAEPRKGLAVLLRAFARVRARRPRATLTLVGVTPEEAERTGTTTGVRALGYVAPESLPTCFRAADVLVAPSLHGESQGIVLLEALAAGVAVVASDLPGYRDTLAGAGVIVPAGDDAALGDAITRLLASPETRAARAAAGRARAEAFDWPRVIGRLEAVLRGVARPGR